MLSALYAIASPSVCLSPSVTRWIQSKTVEVRIMKFSPHGSPVRLVFTGQVLSRNSKGFPMQSGGVKQERGRENKAFSRLKRKYLENGRRNIQSYY